MIRNHKRRNFVFYFVLIHLSFCILPSFINSDLIIRVTVFVFFSGALIFSVLYFSSLTETEDKGREKWRALALNVEESQSNLRYFFMAI